MTYCDAKEKERERENQSLIVTPLLLNVVIFFVVCCV